jgi:hypothetical protein
LHQSAIAQFPLEELVHGRVQNPFQQNVQITEIVGHFVFGNLAAGQFRLFAERTRTVHDGPVGHLNREVVFGALLAASVRAFQHGNDLQGVDIV